MRQTISKKRMAERIDQLSQCSESSTGVTRKSFTAESERAGALVIRWMEEAGMSVWKDALNNIIGKYKGKHPGAASLLIGSHIDTVIDGGKYDGMLGIIAAIEVVHALHKHQVVPDHPIEVVSFCDEEGVRFHTTFLGSRAITGALTLQDLESRDGEGISLAEALENIGLDSRNYTTARRFSNELLGYLELHIEQGPVLEQINLPCGVVTDIAGASRVTFYVEGKAGHAGTVPVSLRKDALAGAAEVVLEIEKLARQYSPLVATVGRLEVKPGASNVIPGLVYGTLDIRDVNPDRKRNCMESIFRTTKDICARRGLSYGFKEVLEIPPVQCSPHFVRVLEDAMQKNGITPVRMTSGAGHDAMAMAHITDTGMIFVRCKGGISHHPEESVTAEDMEAGAKVLLDSVIHLTVKKELF
jgi:allantoate deiminase